MQTKTYKEELKSFGQRLKAIRKHKKLTLIDMQVLTGIDNGDLSRIENGKINIEFITIANIASVLEVPIFKLFDYESPLPTFETKNKINTRRTHR